MAACIGRHVSLHTTQFPLPAPRTLGVAAAKLGFCRNRRQGVPLAASKLKDASTDEDVEPLSPPLAHSRRSRSRWETKAFHGAPRRRLRPMVCWAGARKL
jgi:hypothetical protein